MSHESVCYELFNKPLLRDLGTTGLRHIPTPYLWTGESDLHRAKHRHRSTRPLQLSVRNSIRKLMPLQMRDLCHTRFPLVNRRIAIHIHSSSTRAQRLMADFRLVCVATTIRVKHVLPHVSQIIVIIADDPVLATVLGANLSATYPCPI